MVSGGYWWLLGVIESYWGLLVVIGGYWGLLGVIGGYWGLLGVAVMFSSSLIERRLCSSGW